MDEVVSFCPFFFFFNIKKKMYNLVKLFLFHKYMKRLRTNRVPQTNRKFNIVFLVYICLEYERERKKIPKWRKSQQFDRMEFQNKS